MNNKSPMPGNLLCLGNLQLRIKKIKQQGSLHCFEQLSFNFCTSLLWPLTIQRHQPFLPRTMERLAEGCGLSISGWSRTGRFVQSEALQRDGLMIGVMPEQAGATDLPFETCTSLILPKNFKKRDFGASLSHFQEKLKAKWSVTSLYRRQSPSGYYSANEGMNQRWKKPPPHFYK